MSNSDTSAAPVVLQIGAPWCKHCKPVEEVVKALESEYKFEFVYTDASDSDLTDYFTCTRLPTIVIYSPQTKETTMHEALRTTTAPDVIKQSCVQKPLKLILDEDF